jgi:hypothetical protein
MKRVRCLLLGSILASFAAVVHGETLSAALGCEIMNNTAKAANSSRSTRYVLLYKTSNTYTRVCLDEIGTAEEEPLRCFQPEISATSLWTNGYSSNYSNTSYRYVLDRKDLILSVAPVGMSPIRGYQQFYGGSEELLKPDFLDANPDYRCQLSPDAQSTANFIRNAKAEQLSANKI